MIGAKESEIASMIAEVIAREGGYVAHPADRGGATKYGVTHGALRAWRGEAVTAEDVRALSRAEAAALYRALYYERPRLFLLPAPLQPFLFDCAVHHGPRSAALLLQRVLNESGFPCREDGVIGAETAQRSTDALSALDNALLERLLEARLRIIDRIVANDTSQRVFLRGWVRRIESFRRRPLPSAMTDGEVASHSVSEKPSVASPS
jgi:lysozyme family protein